MCNMFGNDNTETRTIVQRTSGETPAYIEGPATQAIATAGELTDRPYPLFDGQRIAGFNQDTNQGFQGVRDNQNVWEPYTDNALQNIQASSQNVNQADIDRYQNPYIEDVVNTTLGELDRSHNRNVNKIHADQVGRGSYLNEDRRAVIDNLANESNERVKAETAGKLRAAGFSDAMDIAQGEKNRLAKTAGISAAAAPTVSQLGYTDALGLQDIGSRQQAQEQANLSLEHQDFLDQFYYDQDQLNYLMSIIQGAPFQGSQTSTTNTPVPQSNGFAEALGAFSSLAGGLGSLGVKFGD